MVRKYTKIKKGGNIEQNNVPKSNVHEFAIRASGEGQNIFKEFTNKPNTEINPTSLKEPDLDNLTINVKSKVSFLNVMIVLIIIGLCVLIYLYRENIKSYFHNLFNIKEEKEVIIEKNKEVFNILENNYTYEEAENVCKKINNSTLANYDQILNAYNNGAEWCNYGWSQNKLALYPMQTDKENCGNKGINGGYFDENLKFGVNCYGIKPDESDFNSNYYLDVVDNIKKDEDIQDISNNTTDLSNNTNILGFNKFTWSRYT